MAKKVKLKKQAKLGVVLVVLLIIGSIAGVKLYKDYQYRQTYEYKLLELEYKLEDTKILIKKLTEPQLDEILTKKHDANLVVLVNEKYFLYRNLPRYLEYLAKHESLALNEIITLVNVKRDREFYEEPAATDTAKGILMLVNKYHNLDKDYNTDKIVKVSSTYAYAGNSLHEEAYTAFKELAEEAKLSGYTIVLTSSYRSYHSQEELWTDYKNSTTQKRADQYAARAGHSEHQTGYAIDVADFYDTNDKFGETEAFIWMQENAHLFGFILRYPKEKENITGYAYEPWHYRYLGKEEAAKVYAEKITFDEYYEFYLAK